MSKITIDEAIKSLKDILFDNPEYLLDSRGKSIKLGIEALKATKTFRKGVPAPALWLLPGEDS